MGGLEQTEALAAVDPRAQGLPPGSVVEIPPHRLLEARFEMPARLPAQLAMHFGGVDGVALVMARPVGHERDQRAARLRRRHEPVEDRADVLDHREVRALALAAEIVALARAAPLDEGDQAGR